MAQTVAILGAGALGQLFAAHLCNAHIKPLLLTRPYSQITEKTHQIDWLTGQLSQYQLTHSPSNLPTSMAALWVLTKATQTEQALRPILDWLPPSVPIVLLHNGMGPQQRLAEQYPDRHWWVGSISDGAERTAPCRVHQRGLGERYAGPMRPETTDTTDITNTTALPAGLAELGFVIDHNIDQRLWQKLTVNAILNPICARERITNGELRHHHPEVIQLAQELSQLSQQLGFNDSADAIVERVMTVAKRTANNRCSTLQDINAGRPTELAAINGYLLQQAKQKALKLPQLERLYHHFTG